MELRHRVLRQVRQEGGRQEGHGELGWNHELESCSLFTFNQRHSCLWIFYFKQKKSYKRNVTVKDPKKPLKRFFCQNTIIPESLMDDT